MAESSFHLTYKLVDNKIPCGGFNLLGGGIKGKDISFVRQLNGQAVDKEEEQRIHLLLLNEKMILPYHLSFLILYKGALPPVFDF